MSRKWRLAPNRLRHPKREKNKVHVATGETERFADMIIIIENKSSGIEAIDYLFHSEDARGRTRCASPKILCGNPEILRLGIMVSPFDHKYLSYTFSWGSTLADVGEENVIKVVDDYKKLLRGGMDERSFCTLSVLHQRKTGCDVHNIFLKTHLPTGKQFPVFCYTRDDCDLLVRSFQKLQNLKYNWPDPGAMRSLKLKSPIQRGLKGAPKFSI